MSLWERHKHNLFKYGHIYATLYGLVVINYTPQRPTNMLLHRLAIIYSHIFTITLIFVLPVYFVRNISALIEGTDRRWKLMLLVSFANTLLKYITVVVTYVANFVHYTAIHEIIKKCQRLEQHFAQDPQLRALSERPFKQFEYMMLLKFALINSMMGVQVAQILQQHYAGAHPVRVHIAVYTFVLWNYTENMADYFYFVNSSALKFYQLLHLQLQQLLREAKLLHYFRVCGQRSGTVTHLCCLMCDRLAGLIQRYGEINKLYEDSVTMHQFQMLGLIFMTLISQLTNFFRLFNLFMKRSGGNASPEIALSMLYALIFYVDTYVVTMVSENIKNELKDIRRTMLKFNQLEALDQRWEEMVETFALQVRTCKLEIHICGLFCLDKRLTYVTAVTGLSYFITLVQFDLYFTSQK